SHETILATLRDQLARRDAELTELRQAIHSRPQTDTEMIKLIERRALDDTQRLLDNHRQEMEAQRRESEKTVTMIERVHRGELESLKTSMQQQIDNLRAGYEQQLTLMRATNEQALATKDRDIARLEADLTDARVVKEGMSPLAKMQEVAEYLEVAKRIAGGR